MSAMNGWPAWRCWRGAKLILNLLLRVLASISTADFFLTSYGFLLGIAIEDKVPCAGADVAGLLLRHARMCGVGDALADHLAPPNASSARRSRRRLLPTPILLSKAIS